MTDTDYKRLWRNGQKDNIKLYNQISMLLKQLDAQADLIKRIRDGEIKIGDITQFMPKDERAATLEFLKKQKAEIDAQTKEHLAGNKMAADGIIVAKK